MAILPLASFAQMSPNINVPYAISNELGVEITPEYPRPNEMIYINLTLYTDDLNSADITWYKDGKAVLSGKGETKYSFRAGPVGQETKIEIKVNLLSGISFSKSFSIDPASVDVVWEADSYVPPFYQGKALHPKQGILKMVAMPEFVKDGRRIPPQNLVYEWSNGINAYQNESGYGKNVVSLGGSLLGRVENIKVLVTDPISGLVAQGSVNIAPVSPEIVFYQNDPYYGNIFDESVAGSFKLKSNEVQILAAPYYFTNEGISFLRFLWMLNGTEVPELSNSRTAIFRKPEDQTEGISNVSLRVENTNRILQQADGSLQMQF